MEEKKETATTEEIRIDPARRLCPNHDSHSIRLAGIPSERMGVRVVDNCPEEHQQ